MREDAETSAHSTVRPRVRLTPVPTCRGDPSIDFQTLGNEEKDMKDHIIQNVCSKFAKCIDFLDNFPVPFWRMFMNDCLWSVFNLE